MRTPHTDCSMLDLPTIPKRNIATIVDFLQNNSESWYVSYSTQTVFTIFHKNRRAELEIHIDDMHFTADTESEFVTSDLKDMLDVLKEFLELNYVLRLLPR